MFSLHVLDYIILTDELLTTVRALVVLLFNIVLILRTLVHVADHLILAAELLITVEGGYVVLVCSLSSVFIHSSM